MDQIQNCPVCNGPINPGDHECPRCGFRLAGATEQFSPVRSRSTATPDDGTETTYSKQYSLFVTKGPQINEEFYLDEGETSIGRDPRCDIFLNDMTVSRAHAIITVDESGVSIKDDHSLNGTWVNGAVVNQMKLEPGALLQIGTFNLVLQEHRAI